MTVALVVCGLLLGCMIGISVYAARALPSDARIPIHYGLGSYNNFASKTVGLIMWPAAGVVAYAIFAATGAGAVRPHGHAGSSIFILPVVFVLLVVAQIGAIRTALGSGQDER